MWAWHNLLFCIREGELVSHLARKHTVITDKIIEFRLMTIPLKQGGICRGEARDFPRNWFLSSLTLVWNLPSEPEREGTLPPTGLDHKYHSALKPAVTQFGTMSIPFMDYLYTWENFNCLWRTLHDAIQPCHWPPNMKNLQLPLTIHHCLQC